MLWIDCSVSEAERVCLRYTAALMQHETSAWINTYRGIGMSRTSSPNAAAGKELQGNAAAGKLLGLGPGIRIMLKWILAFLGLGFLGEMQVEIPMMWVNMVLWKSRALRGDRDPLRATFSHSFTLLKTTGAGSNIKNR